MENTKLYVKIADQAWELEEVCRLNHQTFSEEIPQHAKTVTGLLVDKFHEENQYIICLNENEIVGMIALRDVRPFSLDYKLDDLDSYLPPFKSLCELRLLNVKPHLRKSKVFYLLLKEVFVQFAKKHYDFVLITGILAQQKLYRSIGFVPFGPLVGDDVKFQPMYISLDFFMKSKHNLLASKIVNKRLNALPGPVDIKPIVSSEFQLAPESHRGETFIQKYNTICQSLSQLVKAKNVQIFTGSGTLANEIMLSHLSALSLKGLIISNGEFGNRIINQAHKHSLNFVEYKVDLGEELNLDVIEQIFQNNKDIKWFYFVHCETSIGAMNDLNILIEKCNQKNILVLVDCISTIGIVPLDLSKVYMAAASSGKALGSYSGLALVFYNDVLPTSEGAIPVYLDLNYYIEKAGMPFTMNSNALYALGSAVNTIDVNMKYKTIKEQTLWLRNQISQLFTNIKIYDSKLLHPAIITFTFPKPINSAIVGKQLEQQNVFINYNSDYLIKQNMVQICLFSETTKGDLQNFIGTLKSILSSQLISSC